MQFLGPMLWLGAIPNTPVGRIRTFHGLLLIHVLMRPALRRPFGRMEEALKRYTRRPADAPPKTGGESPHKKDSKFDPLRTSRVAGSGKPCGNR